jgi:hypothetical protein
MTKLSRKKTRKSANRWDGGDESDSSGTDDVPKAILKVILNYAPLLNRMIKALLSAEHNIFWGEVDGQL